MSYQGVDRIELKETIMHIIGTEKCYNIRLSGKAFTKKESMYSTDSTKPKGVAAKGKKCVSKGTMTAPFSQTEIIYRKPYSEDLSDITEKFIHGSFDKKPSIQRTGGKKMPYKKNRTKASIMKISLERPEVPFKVALFNQNYEFLKFKHSFNIQKRMVSELYTKNGVLHEQLDRNSKCRIRKIEAEYEQYRKEAKKKDEEIKCFKQLYESLEKKMDNLKLENEKLHDRNEKIKKLAEKLIRDGSNKSPIVHSAKLTIKDNEVVLLQDEMKKLEKKLEMLEKKMNEKNIPTDDDSLNASKEIPDFSSVST
ncbi:hypothetical protein TNCT_516841 [Trichonephila clavata]|uniref:Uncharacterized protein n=1 Tax=Trichonephila clavata TaxID=2740835 RepID=A0A8X6LIZ9_TRICU|nr:hypothetical protein TNCT_516841 [Trichonephila clavata]